MFRGWNERRLWTLGIFLFAVLSGLGIQMRGALLISFKDTFSVSESLLGLVAPAATAGFVFFLLFTGMRAGRIDVRKYLFVGVGLSILFTFFVGVSFSFPLLLFFLFGRGVAEGIFRGVDRPTLSHLYPERRGWIFSLHGLAWALGAAASPLFVNFIISFASWRLAYFLLAAFFLPVLFLVWKIDPQGFEGKESSISLKELGKILRNPVVIGMISLIVMSTGIEGGFFTWLPYYADKLFSRSTANLAFFGYLVAYVPGRYFYSRLSGREDYLNLVLLNSSLVVVLLFLTFVVVEGYVILALVFIVGFLISGNFPILLSMGTERFPEFSGPINALAMTASAFGLGVFPAIQGVFMDIYPAEVAMRFLIFLAVSVFLIGLVLRRNARAR